MTALWTDKDEAREVELYLEGRSAFWLFPDRWEGVEPHGLMNFDDGSWRPPEVGDTMCPRCFSYRHRICEPDLAPILILSIDQVWVGG